MVVRSWLLSREDWPGVGPWANGTVLMAERPRNVVLGRPDDLEENFDGEWRRGHCFTEEWHLRWHRLGTAVRLVGFGSVPERSEWGDPAAERSLEDLNAEPRSVVLWGQQEEGEEMWLELRIPNVMTPPTQHPSGHAPTEQMQLEAGQVRRVLQFVTYRSPDPSATDFHRYLGVGYARSDDEDTTFDVLGHPAA